MKNLFLTPVIFSLALYSVSGVSQTQDENPENKTQEPVPAVLPVVPSDSPIVQAALPPAVPASGTIPARTPVKFFLGSLITTKTAMPGQQFQLTVAEDVQINNVTLIPIGTPATGEIIHAQKAKGFGKAGELSMTIRFIDLNGQKIKMRAFQPYRGKDNSNTAMAVSMIPYVGLLAGFAQGGNIEIPAQTLVEALIATDTVIGSDTTSAVTLPLNPVIDTPTNSTNTINGESK